MQFTTLNFGDELVTQKIEDTIRRELLNACQ